MVWLVLLLMAIGVLGYFGGSLRLWSDGVHWPLARLAWWAGGWVCVGATLVGPLAERAHHDLAGHMVAHVLAGMLAPLLLVRSAPVTLLLRVLRPVAARRLGRVFTARPVAVLTHPVTATLMNVGGLYLLYRTGLLAATLADQWAHLAVSLHVVAAGYLFTFAVLAGPDPAPHRAPAAWRAGALIAAVAAHNILAKLVHAHPPPGVPAEQAEAAGQVMYYGGAPVEIVLILLVCRSWLLPRRGALVRRFHCLAILDRLLRSLVRSLVRSLAADPEARRRFRCAASRVGRRHFLVAFLVWFERCRRHATGIPVTRRDKRGYSRQTWVFARFGRTPIPNWTGPHDFQSP